MVSNKLKYLYFILLFIYSCNNSAQERNKKNEIQAFSNMDILINDNILNGNNKYKINNDSILVTYKEEGNCYIDYVDYENKYKLLIFFKIPNSFQELFYTDEDFKKININYSWICYSKFPIKKQDHIKEGVIKISKINEGYLKLDMRLDMGFRFDNSVIDKSNTIIRVVKDSIPIIK